MQAGDEGDIDGGGISAKRLLARHRCCARGHGNPCWRLYTRLQNHVFLCTHASFCRIHPPLPPGVPLCSFTEFMQRLPTIVGALVVRLRCLSSNTHPRLQASYTQADGVACLKRRTTVQLRRFRTAQSAVRCATYHALVRRNSLKHVRRALVEKSLEDQSNPVFTFGPPSNMDKG